MTRTKDLRIENSIDIFDLFSLFVPDRKNKYVELLLRIMKKTKNIESHKKEVVSKFVTEFNLDINELEKVPTLQLILFYRIVEDMFNFEDLKSFQKFCQYNERGIIKQNDLGRYSDFEQILSELSVAELIHDQKKLEKQTITLLDDDEWLIVRPLTYLSSKKYGANTKWCTTQENNSDYFIKYSTKGVLVYCINKKTGYKVAVFYSLDKNEPEFSFWNQKDTRIDSFETELTEDIKKLIWSVVKDKKVKTNRFLLDESERLKEDKLLNLRNTSTTFNMREERINYINRAVTNIEVDEDSPSSINTSETE